MPGATIPRAITPQETTEALRQQPGSGYRVTSHSGGSRDKLTVSHGGVAFAAVHLTVALLAARVYRAAVLQTGGRVRLRELVPRSTD